MAYINVWYFLKDFPSYKRLDSRQQNDGDNCLIIWHLGKSAATAGQTTL